MQVDDSIKRLGVGFRSGMTPDELYKSARAWWNLSPRRAANYPYAVAIHRGITRAVWEIDSGSWRSWEPRPGRRLRWSFVGHPAPAAIHDQFVGELGSRVPERRPDGRATFGQANPIGYWPS
jgi:hypothetical protein